MAVSSLRLCLLLITMDNWQPPKTVNSIILIMRLAGFAQKSDRILFIPKAIWNIFVVFGGCQLDNWVKLWIYEFLAKL